MSGPTCRSQGLTHSSVQAWLTRLSARLAPATVDKCRQLMSGVMKAAIRDHLISSNPVDGVQLPKKRRKAGQRGTITMDNLTALLLPVVPHRYRALVALAGGTGLRWGECIGLRWDAVTENTLRVERVAVEVGGHVTCKPYPKSLAGLRDVPVPPMVMQLLLQHRELYGTGPRGEVFTNETGTAPRRTLFRARIWRPSLVRAGLLGQVSSAPDDKTWCATWPTAAGVAKSSRHPTYAQAVQNVARNAAGGLRFHDLRHSYASWLITSGVPIADAQKVMGHENPHTLLSIYTHVQKAAKIASLTLSLPFRCPLTPVRPPRRRSTLTKLTLARCASGWA